MTEFKPLATTLVIILALAFIFPYILGFFVDINDIQENAVVNPLINLINNGYELSTIPFVEWDDFDINPFFWISNSNKVEITENLKYLGVVPEQLLIMILIFTIISIIYSVIKLLPST